MKTGTCGHLDTRLVKVQCVKCYKRNYWLSRKDYFKVKNREWELANPDRVKAKTAKRTKYVQSLPYPQQILQKYGLSPEGYMELLRVQDNKCAICGSEPTRFRLSVDHCHKTGKVRGLLCSSCNRGLGYLKDDQETVKKALQYLGGQT